MRLSLYNFGVVAKLTPGSLSMSGVRKVAALVCLSFWLQAPSHGAQSSVGVSPGVLDRLERERFGHTNRDIRLNERVDVLEWSVMGGRQAGSLGERFSAIEQKISTEDGVASTTCYGPTYDTARTRAGYPPGRYSARKYRSTHTKTKSAVIVAAHGYGRRARENFTPRRSVQAVIAQLITRGNGFYINGEYNKSILELTHAIRLLPSYAPAYVCRGYAYGKLGRTKHERADFEVARKLDSRIQLPL